jgi:hypothetical protein
MTKTLGLKGVMPTNRAAMDRQFDQWHAATFLNIDMIDRADPAKVHRMLQIYLKEDANAEILYYTTKYLPMWKPTVAVNAATGMPRNGPIPSRTEIQRGCLKYLTYLNTQFEFMRGATSPEEAHLRTVRKVEMCIPCILHLELRVGDKTLKHCCQFTISLARNEAQAKQVSKCWADCMNKIWTAGSTVDSITAEMLADTDTVICSDYKVAMRSATEVEHLKCSGTRQRDVLKNISAIIDRVVSETKLLDQISAAQRTAAEATIADYKLLFRRYKNVCCYLRYRRNFTDPEIRNFQHETDKFCRLYSQMFGAGDETNYIHDLQSGHLADFLDVYRNLYRYANFGLESFVGTIRTYVHRRTKQGGFSGRDLNGVRNKRPVAKDVAAYSNRLVARTMVAIDPASFNITEMANKGKAARKLTSSKHRLIAYVCGDKVVPEGTKVSKQVRTATHGFVVGIELPPQQQLRDEVEGDEVDGGTESGARTKYRITWCGIPRPEPAFVAFGEGAAEVEEDVEDTTLEVTTLYSPSSFKLWREPSKSSYKEVQPALPAPICEER